MDEKHYLSSLFEPRSVAIIGATEREGALGRVLVQNMLDAGFQGALHAVNPKHRTVLGITCRRRIGDVPRPVDLAIIATPARTVPDIVTECGKAGVKAAVVLSAGFGETGAAGAQLEMETVRNAKRHGLRLLGPNSLGLARPALGLNATFALGKPLPGSIGFISQSGALCAAILDYARPNQVGFSSIVALGVASDIDFGEVLDYMVWDSRCESILLYIEGVRDARRFLSALRAAARAKPVMVLKSGRHPVGLRAAQSHTRVTGGDDAVFDAALRRAGVIRLENLSQLYAASKALFAHFRPRGNRLAIVTNGGGPGVLAADCAGDLGIPLADLSTETLVRLDRILPPEWSRDNPVDLVGDSDPERYAQALAELLTDSGVDGVLCLLSPQAMTRPVEVAERVIALARHTEKPILTCWLGDEQARTARDLLQTAGIPSLRTPENAVELFSNLSAYYRNQQLLTQVAAPIVEERPPLLEAARLIIDTALKARRTTLTRLESMALLAAFHIPTVPMHLAHHADEAETVAAALGFPVTLRPNAPLPVLGSNAVRPRHNLHSAVAVSLAWAEMNADITRSMPEALHDGIVVESTKHSLNVRQLMLRVWRDPVFGPVIGVGERSLDPQYWPDRAVGLPPLNAFLANDLLYQTRAARRMQALDGLPAANVKAVEDLLENVSEIVCELPWVRAVELNPLLVDDIEAIVIDARIEIGSVPKQAGRYDHMAIHPYPANMVRHARLRDGSPVLLRPLKPEDAELEQEFVRRLSPETKYFRFMNALRELPQSLLAKLTQIDYDREMAFVATIERNGREFQIGVSRYATNPDGDSCEFAIVVADEYQHSGLGRQLMALIIESARERGLVTMKGVFLASNERMLRFVEALGFKTRRDTEDKSVWLGELALQERAP
ncbi:MAG: GNAT family N-acetyltransferase [Moraxellaceae bacterium]|nr:GNAT family N-acetyltransferase [Moraxellaceae bacterium]